MGREGRCQRLLERIKTFVSVYLINISNIRRPRASPAPEWIDNGGSQKQIQFKRDIKKKLTRIRSQSRNVMGSQYKRHHTYIGGVSVTVYRLVN